MEIEGSVLTEYREVTKYRDTSRLKVLKQAVLVRDQVDE